MSWLKKYEDGGSIGGDPTKPYHAVNNPDGFGKPIYLEDNLENRLKVQNYADSLQLYNTFNPKATNFESKNYSHLKKYSNQEAAQKAIEELKNKKYSLVPVLNEEKWKKDKNELKNLNYDDYVTYEKRIFGKLDSDKLSEWELKEYNKHKNKFILPTNLKTSTLQDGTIIKKYLDESGKETLTTIVIKPDGVERVYNGQNRLIRASDINPYEINHYVDNSPVVSNVSPTPNFSLYRTVNGKKVLNKNYYTTNYTTEAEEKGFLSDAHTRKYKKPVQPYFLKDYPEDLTFVYGNDNLDNTVKNKPFDYTENLNKISLIQNSVEPVGLSTNQSNLRLLPDNMPKQKYVPDEPRESSLRSYTTAVSDAYHGRPVGYGNDGGKPVELSADEYYKLTGIDFNNPKDYVPKNKKEYGGWLNQYEQGGPINGDPVPYKTLQPVEITPYSKDYPQYSNLTTEERNLFNSKSPIGRAIQAKAKHGSTYDLNNLTKNVVNAVTYPVASGLQALQIPQSLMVEGIEHARGNDYDYSNVFPRGFMYDKQRSPSDTFLKGTGLIPELAGDMLLDPLNVVGAGYIKNFYKAPTGSTGKNILKLFGKEVKEIPETAATTIKGSKQLDNAYDVSSSRLYNENTILPQLDDVGKKFKSEIDWSKWNKEIPDNKALMKEYNAIEETTKANGTWMKNPDGSAFKGTPEQFVQQNSQNFKKAYTKGFGTTYRGDRNHYEIMNERDFHSTTFTGDRELATNYTYDKAKPFTRNSPLGVNPNYGKDIMSSEGIYELYYPKTKNVIKIAGKNKDYSNLPITDKNILNFIEPKGRNIFTDDIATYIKSKNIDRAIIDDVYDSSFKPGQVIINNNKPGNYLKSMWGNNGMFDMTNPNIYKSLVPTALGTGVGLKAASQSDKKQMGGWLNKYN